MAEDLIELIYASAMTAPMSSQELAKILTISRRNNGALGVTGLLLQHRRSFLQVLEGPTTVVEEVFDRVIADPRHDSVLILRKGPIVERAFGEWQMGAVDLQHVALPGISTFLRDGQLGLLNGDRVEGVLRGFRDGRYHRFVDVGSPSTNAKA